MWGGFFHTGCSAGLGIEPRIFQSWRKSSSEWTDPVSLVYAPLCIAKFCRFSYRWSTESRRRVLFWGEFCALSSYFLYSETRITQPRITRKHAQPKPSFLVSAWVMIIFWAYLQLLVITWTDKLWLVPPNYLLFWLDMFTFLCIKLKFSVFLLT